MLDYNVRIGLLPMRRNTNDRPRGDRPVSVRKAVEKCNGS